MGKNSIDDSQRNLSVETHFTAEIGRGAWKARLSLDNRGHVFGIFLALLYTILAVGICALIFEIGRRVIVYAPKVLPWVLSAFS